MIDGTEKPEIPLKFAKRSRDTKNLAIIRDFWGYSKLIFLFFVLYHLCSLEIFIVARKFGMGFSGG